MRSVPEQIATILRKKYQLCVAPTYDVEEGHNLVLCVLGLKLSSGGRDGMGCVCLRANRIQAALVMYSCKYGIDIRMEASLDNSISMNNLSFI